MRTEMLVVNILEHGSIRRLARLAFESHLKIIPVHRNQLTHLQVTGPVQRFARQIASHGYIVAAPSSYHEFTGPEALAYDGPGTDAGNAWKIEKKLSAYDEDATLSVDLLTSMETCNGRIGATGMCLGGHLAFRCAFDKRIRAAVCYFATDIHSQTLGKGKNDDSIKRVKDISGELIMVCFRLILSEFSGL
jgi:carboxymethylenebutenolidase